MCFYCWLVCLANDNRLYLDLKLLLKKTAPSNVEAPFWKTSRTHHGHLGNPLPSQMIALDFVLGKAPHKKNRHMRFKYLLSFGVSWMFVVFAGRLFSTFPKYNVSKAKFQHLKLQTPPGSGWCNAYLMRLPVVCIARHRHIPTLKSSSRTLSIGDQPTDKAALTARSRYVGM